MTASDKIAERLFELEQTVRSLGGTAQLSSSTVGSDSEGSASIVSDIISDAVATNDAVPDLQEDAADSVEAASDLQAIQQAADSDLDARLADKDIDLANAREELAAAQQRVAEAFGLQVQGLSDKIDTVVVGTGGSLILFAASEPQGTAPFGSTWFMVKPSDVAGQPDSIVGQWQQTSTDEAPVWSPRVISSEVIANLDVGKLTAGQASIADLVAIKIAASTAQFQTVDIANLFVTESATMKQAVIDFLFTNVVQAKKITADDIDVGSLDGVTVTGLVLRTAATGKRAVLGGNLLRFYDADDMQAGQIEGVSNGATGGMLRISPDGGDTAAVFVGSWALPVRAAVAMRVPSMYVSNHYIDTTMSAATGKVLGGDTDWIPISPGGSGYVGDGASAYRVKNGDIILRGQFTRPNGTVTPGDLIGVLPAGARPPYRSWFLAITGTSGVARCYLDTNGQVYVSSIIGTAGNYLILEQKTVSTVD